MSAKHTVVALAAGFAAMLLPALAGIAGQQGKAALLCSNPVSGARWEMRIDYDRGTVDSMPAHIAPAQISWFDPRDGGYNTYDRESGDLVTALGSSTGGWLRHNRCRLEGAR